MKMAAGHGVCVHKCYLSCFTPRQVLTTNTAVSPAGVGVHGHQLLGVGAVACLRCVAVAAIAAIAAVHHQLTLHPLSCLVCASEEADSISKHPLALTYTRHSIHNNLWSARCVQHSCREPHTALQRCISTPDLQQCQSTPSPITVWCVGLPLALIALSVCCRQLAPAAALISLPVALIHSAVWVCAAARPGNVCVCACGDQHVRHECAEEKQAGGVRSAQESFQSAARPQLLITPHSSLLTRSPCHPPSCPHKPCRSLL